MGFWGGVGGGNARRPKDAQCIEEQLRRKSRMKLSQEGGPEGGEKAGSEGNGVIQQVGYRSKKLGEKKKRKPTINKSRGRKGTILDISKWGQKRGPTRSSPSD